MNGDRKSAKLGITRGNFLLRNRRGGEEAGFRTFGELRHETQLDRIKAVDKNKIDQDEKILLFSKLEKGVYLSGDGQRTFCLFNVIVAFEWNPGYYELELLRNTCDEAANLLFDVTDGYMSFNRIIVGGPELMNCADIQIFASNRLFPRAWVNGLHIDAKYQPIRVGRGYWRKNARRADPWHKNLGAAVLVHEWLHYALGMKDDYVKEENGYALPEASPTVNTLMANLESSELLGDREWNQLRNNSFFDWLKIPAKRKPQNIPPDESPAPRFTLVGTAKEDDQDDRQVWLDWKDAKLSKKMDPEHCWVFVLITNDPERPFKNPDQLIAQGSYEVLPEGYRIIGARKGAFIVLVGHEPNTYVPKVLYSQIADFKGSTIEFWAAGWLDDATPTNCQLPLVSVAIADDQIAPPYKLNVDVVNSDGRDWKEKLFSLGRQQVVSNGKVEALDGHVLLVSTNDDDKDELAIANFSIGGSPGAAFPTGPNPVPAGSSDGNAMIFFYDEEARLLRGTNNQEEELDISSRRIITTTNLLGSSDAIGYGPRSYSFTVTPNKTLPKAQNGEPLFNPTLVLYFDTETKKDHEDAKLKIYRLDQSAWKVIEDKYQEEDPPRPGEPPRQLVAAKLNSTTAPGLFEDPPRPEYYRLFLV